MASLKRGDGRPLGNWRLLCSCLFVSRTYKCCTVHYVQVLVYLFDSLEMTCHRSIDLTNIMRAACPHVVRIRRRSEYGPIKSPLLFLDNTSTVWSMQSA